MLRLEADLERYRKDREQHKHYGNKVGGVVEKPIHIPTAQLLLKPGADQAVSQVRVAGPTQNSALHMRWKTAFFKEKSSIISKPVDACSDAKREFIKKMSAFRSHHPSVFSASVNTHSSTIASLSTLSLKSLKSVEAACNISPSNMTRIPDPVEMELKEGMFTTKKLPDDFFAEVRKVKELYDQKAILEMYKPRNFTFADFTFNMNSPEKRTNVSLEDPKLSIEKICAKNKIQTEENLKVNPDNWNLKKRKLFTSSDKRGTELSEKKLRTAEPQNIDEYGNHKPNSIANPTATNDTARASISKSNNFKKICNRKPPRKLPSDVGLEQFLSKRKGRTPVCSGKKSKVSSDVGLEQCRSTRNERTPVSSGKKSEVSCDVGLEQSRSTRNERTPVCSGKKSEVFSDVGLEQSPSTGNERTSVSPEKNSEVSCDVGLEQSRSTRNERTPVCSGKKSEVSSDIGVEQCRSTRNERSPASSGTKSEVSSDVGIEECRSSRNEETLVCSGKESEERQIKPLQGTPDECKVKRIREAELKVEPLIIKRSANSYIVYKKPKKEPMSTKNILKENILKDTKNILKAAKVKKKRKKEMKIKPVYRQGSHDGSKVNPKRKAELKVEPLVIKRLANGYVVSKKPSKDPMSKKNILKEHNSTVEEKPKKAPGPLTAHIGMSLGRFMM